MKLRKTLRNSNTTKGISTIKLPRKLSNGSKRKLNNMKKALLFLLIFAASHSLLAQGQLTTIGDGGNKKASISENIGLAKITINYDRPGVKGREGKIWNTDIAPYGLT